MELEAEIERELGSDLVGAVGQRRNEQQPRRRACEEFGCCAMNLGSFAGEQVEYGAKPLPQARQRLRRKRLFAVSGDPDGKDERRPRRAVDRMRRGLQVELRGGDRALLQMPPSLLSLIGSYST
jgi:hypothetical protein